MEAKTRIEIASLFSWLVDKRSCNHDYIDTSPIKQDKMELTEFEKCVQNILNEPHFQDIEAVKQFSKTLLDLARKEELLKDLPKWKTYKGELIGTGLSFKDNGNLVLVRKGYYIDVNELEKLPKEE